MVLPTITSSLSSQFGRGVSLFAVDSIPAMVIPHLNCIPLCPLCCHVLAYTVSEETPTAATTIVSPLSPVCIIDLSPEDPRRRMTELSGYMTKRVCFMKREE